MDNNLHWLKHNKVNKSTAFTHDERDQKSIRGLLPYAVSTQMVQVKRVLRNLRKKPTNIDKYSYLSALQSRNERLFYRVLIENIEELLPIVYTPTVGEACREYSHLFSETKGFYITPDDKGMIAEILKNWPEEDIRVIVVTDGQRILGLGDLGANGMGIPIGKLILYSACAGINPAQCLPVMLDVGTNNQQLLDDPFYLGYPHKRIEGDAYVELVDEFIMSIQQLYPKALIQFEDFLTPNAYGLLKSYKDKVLCFNDDIQGTASVALAGVYASTRITKKVFSELTIMFLGAGSAATGIADLISYALEKEGLDSKAARSHLWFVDVNGLVVAERNDLMDHNLPYAHEHEHLSFVDAIKSIKPDILIGATGAAGTFTQEVIEEMTKINEHPVIFALSNPTTNAECTAEQAYTWSNGQAVFVSGSPFDNVQLNGKSYDPGQGNNAYIFPGLGLGVTACQSEFIPDEFFLVAAQTLSELVTEEDLNHGSLYPPIREIRDVSLQIAESVAEKAYEMNLAKAPRSGSMRGMIESLLYDPYY
ncbi:MAG: NAD-dependent malic enzyme [Flavobacteriia bacterium]|jgi:malate dehydrogenase (oxaloacetate-decarboxylating)(NADP+)|nr:NAD-dependent malic enzyme [Cryomorphaceae bacterium]